jgi:hypothetical protein
VDKPMVLSMDYQSIITEGEEEALRIVDEHEVQWEVLSREYDQTNKQWEGIN